MHFIFRVGNNYLYLVWKYDKNNMTAKVESTDVTICNFNVIFNFSTGIQNNCSEYFEKLLENFRCEVPCFLKATFI